MTTVKKVKTAASVFELPQRLVLQYVEYERAGEDEGAAPAGFGH